MFKHYPQISKQGHLQVNTHVLSDDINHIINSYLPNAVYCHECNSTLEFNQMMFEYKMVDKIKHPPVKCRQDKLVVCSVCHYTTLCIHHAAIAHKNASIYTSNCQYMCDNCCWNEIT